MKNKIKIIVPFYNPGKFLDRCVNSLLTQDYENYEILFIDDCSSDGSFNKIPAVKYKGDENGELLKDEKGEPAIESKHPLLDKTKCQNILAWRSGERATALPNLHNGIMRFATDPNDIVVIVDGDDWLFNKKVLSYINDFYNKNSECWMMYGSSKWTDNRPCCAKEYTKKDFKSLRKVPFKISHIRTFRAGLYVSIAEQDFDYECMKNSNGEWYKMSYDVAMFLPMLEMAGKEHVYYNNTPLYVYNRENPISDDKVNQKLQTSIHIEVFNKNPFNKIEDYKLEKIETND
jgi:glycosyltransferase involved in cell wall biosynthesis